MHGKNIVHFDVKPENMLLKLCDKVGSKILAICDFGASGQDGDERSFDFVEGTPRYRSPELARINNYPSLNRAPELAQSKALPGPGKRRYKYTLRKPADVWAFGVSIYAVVDVTGKPLFSRRSQGTYKDYAEFFDKLKHLASISTTEPWCQLDTNFRSVVFKMFDVNPQERPLMSDVAQACPDP